MRAAFARSETMPAAEAHIPAQASAEPPEGYGRVYDQAYDKGYDRGYDKGVREGFKKGHYAGGDGLVDQLLPGGMILPEIEVRDIIAAGIESLKHHLYPVMGTEEVVGLMRQAMDERTPFSLVRLGDGELLTMAQDVLMSVKQVREEGGFLSYAGVQVPDLSARDQVVEAVRGASVVGLPLLRVPNFQPLFFAVCRAYGIDYRSLRLTHSTINYAIYLEHNFPGLVAGRRVLLVGNQAGPLAGYLRSNGVHVVDAISPVQGMADVPRVLAEIAARSFDIALVSAGVPAVVIAYKIASELGGVAVDFGHLADSMAKGEAPFV